MKRILSVFTAVLLLIVLSFAVTVRAVPEASADEDKKVTVIFGDSIGTGYALEGYSVIMSRQTEGSFARLLCDELGLENNKTYYNFSVNGYPSSKILNKIRDTDEDILARADLFVISAGGNDVMDTYGTVISQAVMLNYQLIVDSGLDKVKMNSDDDVENAVIATLLDPEKSELINTLTEVCTNEEAMKLYASVTDDYVSNLKEMIAFLRSKNSDADIVILAPYDPLQTIPYENKLLSSVSGTISEMDRKACELMNDSSCNYKLHVISLSKVFDGAYEKLTNISKLDIHPNKEGHRIIFEQLMSALAASVQKSSTVQESSTSMQAVSEGQQDEAPAAITNYSAKDSGFGIPDYVTYILLAAAVCCIVGISVFFVIKRIKEKKAGK